MRHPVNREAAGFPPVNRGPANMQTFIIGRWIAMECLCQLKKQDPTIDSVMIQLGTHQVQVTDGARAATGDLPVHTIRLSWDDLYEPDLPVDAMQQLIADVIQWGGIIV